MTNFYDFSVTDWLYYLENIHQDEIQLGLERIRRVAERLGVLQIQTEAYTILVAGTNGKGSTVAALEGIYHEAGYQVGSYTSPHLVKFNERIRVNQQFISDDDLCDIFCEIEAVKDSVPLTYFEIVTLAALLYFKRFSLDVIILEVGMGGRLDATNIIEPDLAIITTVDLDHQDFLGDTKEKIGYEKAGILRQNKPFIYADILPPKTVLEQAQLLNAQPILLGKDYDYFLTEESLEITYGEKLVQLPKPKVQSNAAVAAIIASCYLSNRLPVKETIWRDAMQKLFLPGRLHLVEGRVTTLFDVAHNPQAVQLLVNFIKQYQLSSPGSFCIHVVFSGLKNKDLCGLIKPMLTCVNFWYPALLSGKRAASELQLLAAFDKVLNKAPPCFASPATAYRMANQQANAGDLIVVYGSFLTVGAVMAAGINHAEQENL